MRLSPRTEFALAARRPDDALDLEELCLSIARLRLRDLDFQAVSARLDAMAEQVADRLVPGSPPDRLANAIAQAFGGELGLRGASEDYQRLDSSMLDRVVETRRGLPILLSVVWILLGKRLGLPLRGVGYPRHFIACLDLPSARIYLDPFQGGVRLDPRDLLEGAGGQRALLAPIGVRPLVTRVLGNIKNLAIDQTDWTLALEVVERMQVLAGDDPLQTRDRGLLCMHLGRQGEARRDLERYLAQVPDALDRSDVEQVLLALREN